MEEPDDDTAVTNYNSSDIPIEQKHIEEDAADTYANSSKNVCLLDANISKPLHEDDIGIIHDTREKEISVLHKDHDKESAFNVIGSPSVKNLEDFDIHDEASSLNNSTCQARTISDTSSELELIELENTLPLGNSSTPVISDESFTNQHSTPSKESVISLHSPHFLDLDSDPMNDDSYISNACSSSSPAEIIDVSEDDESECIPTVECNSILTTHSLRSPKDCRNLVEPERRQDEPSLESIVEDVVITDEHIQTDSNVHSGSCDPEYIDLESDSSPHSSPVPQGYLSSSSIDEVIDTLESILPHGCEDSALRDVIEQAETVLGDADDSVHLCNQNESNIDSDCSQMVKDSTDEYFDCSASLESVEAIDSSILESPEGSKASHNDTVEVNSSDNEDATNQLHDGNVSSESINKATDAFIANSFEINEINYDDRQDVNSSHDNVEQFIEQDSNNQNGAALSESVNEDHEAFIPNYLKLHEPNHDLRKEVNSSSDNIELSMEKDPTNQLDNSVASSKGVNEIVNASVAISSEKHEQNHVTEDVNNLCDNVEHFLENYSTNQLHDEGAPSKDENKDTDAPIVNSPVRHDGLGVNNSSNNIGLLVEKDSINQYQDKDSSSENLTDATDAFIADSLERNDACHGHNVDVNNTSDNLQKFIKNNSDNQVHNTDGSPESLNEISVSSVSHSCEKNEPNAREGVDNVIENVECTIGKDSASALPKKIASSECLTDAMDIPVVNDKEKDSTNQLHNGDASSKSGSGVTDAVIANALKEIKLNHDVKDVVNNSIDKNSTNQLHVRDASSKSGSGVTDSVIANALEENQPNHDDKGDLNNSIDKNSTNKLHNMDALSRSKPSSDGFCPELHDGSKSSTKKPESVHPLIESAKNNLFVTSQIQQPVESGHTSLFSSEKTGRELKKPNIEGKCRLNKKFASKKLNSEHPAEKISSFKVNKTSMLNLHRRKIKTSSEKIKRVLPFREEKVKNSSNFIKKTKKLVVTILNDNDVPMIKDIFQIKSKGTEANYIKELFQTKSKVSETSKNKVIYSEAGSDALEPNMNTSGDTINTTLNKCSIPLNDNTENSTTESSEMSLFKTELTGSLMLPKVSLYKLDMQAIKRKKKALRKKKDPKQNAKDCPTAAEIKFQEAFDKEINLLLEAEEPINHSAPNAETELENTAKTTTVILASKDETSKSMEDHEGVEMKEQENTNNEQTAQNVCNFSETFNNSEIPIGCASAVNEQLGDPIQSKDNLPTDFSISIKESENPPTYDDIRPTDVESKKRRSVPTTLIGKEDLHHQCCGHWFINRKQILNHLIKNSSIAHEKRLIEEDYIKCPECNTWMISGSILRHLKSVHSIKSFGGKRVSVDQKKDIASKNSDIKPVNRSSKPCPRSKKVNFAPRTSKPIVCYLANDPMSAESILAIKFSGDLPLHLKPHVNLSYLLNLDKYNISNFSDSRYILHSSDSDSSSNNYHEDSELSQFKSVKKGKNLCGTGLLKKKKKCKYNIDDDFDPSEEKGLLPIAKSIKKVKNLTSPKKKKKVASSPENKTNKQLSPKRIHDASMEVGELSAPSLKKVKRCLDSTKSLKNKKKDSYLIDNDYAPFEDKVVCGKKKQGIVHFYRSKLSSETSDGDSLSDSDSDTDLDFPPINLDYRNKKMDFDHIINDTIPTVELDLFTLSSFDDEMSVLLRDSENPDLKVYASMDAIFVGDSALGDVTNQVGYLTDATNVVFVNPSHFLFPSIEDTNASKLLQKNKPINGKSKLKVFQDKENTSIRVKSKSKKKSQNVSMKKLVDREDLENDVELLHDKVDNLKSMRKDKSESLKWKKKKKLFGKLNVPFFKKHPLYKHCDVVKDASPSEENDPPEEIEANKEYLSLMNDVPLDVPQIESQNVAPQSDEINYTPESKKIKESGPKKPAVQLYPKKVLGHQSCKKTGVPVFSVGKKDSNENSSKYKENKENKEDCSVVKLSSKPQKSKEYNAKVSKMPKMESKKIEPSISKKLQKILQDNELLSEEMKSCLDIQEENVMVTPLLKKGGRQRKYNSQRSKLQKLLQESKLPTQKGNSTIGLKEKNIIVSPRQQKIGKPKKHGPSSIIKDFQIVHNDSKVTIKFYTPSLSEKYSKLHESDSQASNNIIIKTSTQSQLERGNSDTDWMSNNYLDVKKIDSVGSISVQSIEDPLITTKRGTSKRASPKKYDKTPDSGVKKYKKNIKQKDLIVSGQDKKNGNQKLWHQNIVNEVQNYKESCIDKKSSKTTVTNEKKYNANRNQIETEKLQLQAIVKGLKATNFDNLDAILDQSNGGITCQLLPDGSLTNVSMVDTINTDADPIKDSSNSNVVITSTNILPNETLDEGICLEDMLGSQLSDFHKFGVDEIKAPSKTKIPVVEKNRSLKKLQGKLEKKKLIHAELMDKPKKSVSKKKNYSRKRSAARFPEDTTDHGLLKGLGSPQGDLSLLYTPAKSSPANSRKINNIIKGNSLWDTQLLFSPGKSYKKDVPQRNSDLEKVDALDDVPLSTIRDLLTPNKSEKVDTLDDVPLSSIRDLLTPNKSDKVDDLDDVPLSMIRDLLTPNKSKQNSFHSHPVELPPNTVSAMVCPKEVGIPKTAKGDRAVSTSPFIKKKSFNSTPKKTKDSMKPSSISKKGQNSTSKRSPAKTPMNYKSSSRDLEGYLDTKPKMPISNEEPILRMNIKMLLKQAAEREYGKNTFEGFEPEESIFISPKTVRRKSEKLKNINNDYQLEEFPSSRQISLESSVPTSMMEAGVSNVSNLLMKENERNETHSSDGANAVDKNDESCVDTAENSSDHPLKDDDDDDGSSVSSSSDEEFQPEQPVRLESIPIWNLNGSNSPPQSKEKILSREISSPNQKSSFINNTNEDRICNESNVKQDQLSEHDASSHSQVVREMPEAPKELSKFGKIRVKHSDLLVNDIVLPTDECSDRNFSVKQNDITKSGIKIDEKIVHSPTTVIKHADEPSSNDIRTYFARKQKPKSPLSSYGSPSRKRSKPDSSGKRKKDKIFSSGSSPYIKKSAVVRFARGKRGRPRKYSNNGMDIRTFLSPEGKQNVGYKKEFTNEHLCITPICNISKLRKMHEEGFELSESWRPSNVESFVADFEGFPDVLVVKSEVDDAVESKDSNSTTETLEIGKNPSIDSLIDKNDIDERIILKQF